MATNSVSCWVITDGKAGMESQCIGLAEALGIDPAIKRVALRTPWRQLTPYFRIAQSFGFSKRSDSLEAPWPDLVIATGRQSVAAALLVRAKARKAGTRTVLVQLQNPGIATAHFDLVVTPRHDGLRGKNVISTQGALHRVTATSLSEGAARLGASLSHLPRPFIGVLLGGSNAAYTFDPRTAERLGMRLKSCAEALGGSLLVTPSRRTGEANKKAIKEAVGTVPSFFWDGSGLNPYFGMLGLADFLVVTSDSVNMVSEALATGKPVYVADLPGGNAKFEIFHQQLRAEGLTRSFGSVLESYAYDPPGDTAAVAARIGELLSGP